MVFTIGHSTRAIGDFLDLLRQAGVNLLVDVRSIPGSRTNPQFNTDALTASLEGAGIGYVHLRALGGRRRRQAGAPPSPNLLWRNEAFRNYADYALTDEFRGGLNELENLASRNCCAIMCAEAVWWRCHRRIITDYLLADGIQVAHIMGPAETDPATLTPGVKQRADGKLIYEAQ